MNHDAGSNGRRSATTWSRRRFLGTTGGVGAGLLLTGCGESVASPRTVALTDRIGPGGLEVEATEQARRATAGRTLARTLQAQPSTVDIGGRTVSTWTYNGALPGPEIRARVGDTLKVRLENQLPQPTTVHWHGIALRNDMDGVPVLTQPEIPPGGSFEYLFTLPHAGTYMFHPHVGTQLDRGLYAPLIIDDPAEPGDYDLEHVVIFDDWIDGTGQDPDQVLAGLLRNGMGGMGGMGGDHGGMQMPTSSVLGGDAGDTTYPHYVANGRTRSAPTTLDVRPGQRVRFRMINMGGDTAFRVGVPGAPMTVTHTDGFPVAPTDVEAVVIGMGERIDAVVTIPEAPAVLIGIAEGKNDHAAVRLSTPQKSPVDTGAAASALMSRSAVLSQTFASADPVTLRRRAPDVVHDLVLAGPGDRYDWTINGERYDPARGLPISSGQRVRLRMVNTTTMFHPMHLHGHTFQVVGPDGRGPRKDTVLVLPNQTVEVDFDADNPGQWLTHCHNIYHGEAGMMTVVSYVA